MKIFKKIVKYFLILFLLLIIVLISVPIIFKSQIVEQVKEITNESVNAKIDFGEFNLSLISSFPDFSFDINDVSIINKAPFEGDTLAHIGNMNLELDLMSVIGGEYVISSFNISDLTANAKVLKDGKANWDIAIEDTSEIEDDSTNTEELSQEPKDSLPFIAGLKSFSISNVNLSYVDLQSDMVAIVKGFNQSGGIYLINDSTEIDVKTEIESILFDLEGERLAKNLKLESDIKIAADLANMVFQFKENLIKLNELKIGIDGDIEMLDDMIFDLTISAKDNQFKDVLSLIPVSYLSDLEGVETRGDFNLTAHIKGEMDDDNLPGFDIDFGVNNAFLHYPDLPESVENINMELAIDNKNGIIDQTKIDLKLFHLEIAKNPIDLKFFVTNIESDPKMKGEVRSKLDLEKLADAIPLEEGEEYKGRINANFNFGGLLSSIENEKYEEFKSEGNIIFDDLVYITEDLPKTTIKTGYLNFSPNYFEVSNLKILIGNSDILANGRIENILPYIFHDSTIVGKFNIESEFLDLNELTAEDSSNANDQTINDEAYTAIKNAEEIQDSIYEEPMEVVEIPKNINFTLNSTFKKIDFEDMPVEDFTGQIRLENGIANFQNTSFKIYNGTILIDGEYNTQNMAHPSTSLDLVIDGMEIKEAYLAFNSVQKMVPIAKNAQGEFHAELKFSTELDDTLAPIYETMNGRGFLQTKSLGFSETETWGNIVNAIGLKKEKFKKIKAEDVKIKYEFIDGKLHTDPFDLNFGKTKGKVNGYSNFDGEINYKYALKIPREELGSAVNKGAGYLEQLAGKNGMDFSLGDFINVDVLATGTIDKPKYKAQISGNSGSSSIKNKAQDILNENINKIKNKAQDELNEAKKRAEAEAEKLKKEAEEKLRAEAEKLKKEAQDKANSEAERLKKEAEDKIKVESEKAKNKAKDELKNKAKGLLKDRFGR
tara:strand:+ start:2069 stop:4897 length:2829 start_codon:yes stop_codon:yes gene_type:complete